MNKKNYLKSINNSQKPFIIYKTIKGFDLFTDFSNKIILNNNTYPLMITFNPSYLIRYPDNKKYSWEDLKKIREKVKELKLTI